MVSMTTITNISNQSVPILYTPIDPDIAVSAVNAVSKGQLLIPAHGEAEIETQRLDNGQLERFRQLKLITYAQT